MHLSQAQTYAGQVCGAILCVKFIIHSVLIPLIIIKSKNKKYFLCIVLDLRIQNRIFEDLIFSCFSDGIVSVNHTVSY